MFQIQDPALVRAMARHPQGEAARHRSELLARRRRRRSAVLRLARRQISNLLRIRSTGVPSFSGTAMSRS